MHFWLNYITSPLSSSLWWPFQFWCQLWFIYFIFFDICHSTARFFPRFFFSFLRLFSGICLIMTFFRQLPSRPETRLAIIFSLDLSRHYYTINWEHILNHHETQLLACCMAAIEHYEEMSPSGNWGMPFWKRIMCSFSILLFISFWFSKYRFPRYFEVLLWHFFKIKFLGCEANIFLFFHNI